MSPSGGHALHAVAQAGALAGRVLQGDAHRAGTGRRKGFVQALDDLVQAGLLAGAEVGARMQNEEGQAQFAGQLKLLDQRLQGAFPVLRRRTAKVDEVAVVAKDAFQPARGQLVRVAGQFLRAIRLAEPPHVVFDKDLADGGPNLAGPLQGGVNAAGS